MEYLLALLAALSIPSAFTGFLFARLEKKLDKREKEMREKEEAREQSEYMMVKSIGAAIAPGRSDRKSGSENPGRKMQWRHARRPGVCHSR